MTERDSRALPEPSDPEEGEGPRPEGEPEAGDAPEEAYPIHRVALRGVLGALVGGGAAVIPVLILAGLIGYRHWSLLPLAALTSGLMLATAVALGRRLRGRRRVVPLLVFGLLVAYVIGAVEGWRQGMADGRDPLEALLGAVDLIHSVFRRPTMSLLVVLGGLLPFVLGGLGLLRDAAPQTRLLLSVGLTLAGGVVSVFLFRAIAGMGDLVALTQLFVVLPTSVVAGLSLVDLVEPRVVEFLTGLTQRD